MRVSKHRVRLRSAPKSALADLADILPPRNDAFVKLDTFASPSLTQLSSCDRRRPGAGSF